MVWREEACRVQQKATNGPHHMPRSLPQSKIIHLAVFVAASPQLFDAAPPSAARLSLNYDHMCVCQRTAEPDRTVATRCLLIFFFVPVVEKLRIGISVSPFEDVISRVHTGGSEVVL